MFSFVSSFLTLLHPSSISPLFRFAITIDHILLWFIGKVCCVLVPSPARMFAPPPSLGLPFVAVLLVGIPLAS
ncbi:hypothetical protein C1H46_009845 [Malus baccata]|uniref:Uncharacterized protein n=1 Tax=Malus baccata TaxID=106549 RepID=A0A540N0F6_MALBA|nr:hypothetical protein C1H46_009845 [Malus baccata]